MLYKLINYVDNLSCSSPSTNGQGCLKMLSCRTFVAVSCYKYSQKDSHIGAGQERTPGERSPILDSFKWFISYLPSHYITVTQFQYILTISIAC